MRLVVTSVRLVVVDRALQGRPPASTKDAPETGAKNRGKIGGGGAGMRVPFGMGDAVERVAKPIARWLDEESAKLAADWRRPWHTKLAGCSACSWRRRMLNFLVPEVRSWPAWRAAWGKLPVVGRAALSRWRGRKRAG